MTELLELTESGQALVSDAFLQGEESLDRDDLGPYLNHTGIEVDLTPLDERIEAVIENEDYDRKSHIDGAIAETVHETLDLTRREAAIEGIWHYLTVIEYPEFVHHRWDSKMREKFLAGGTDIYSNALHRLWWIAEITEIDGDYTRTREIFEMQELANDVADRWFARHEPIARACVDVLKKEEVEQFDPSNGDIVSDTTTQLREKLTVVTAESLNIEEARELIRELRSDVVEELS